MRYGCLIPWGIIAPCEFQVSRVFAASHEGPAPNVTNDGNSLPNSFPPSQPWLQKYFRPWRHYLWLHLSCCARRATRLAILGTGGIGNTSAVLHILHHQEVVSRYNNCRYFVGCDAVTSAESLATLILQIIQAPSVAGEYIDSSASGSARSAAHLIAAWQLWTAWISTQEGRSSRSSAEDRGSEVRFAHNHHVRCCTTAWYCLDSVWAFTTCYLQTPRVCFWRSIHPWMPDTVKMMKISTHCWQSGLCPLACFCSPKCP